MCSQLARKQRKWDSMKTFTVPVIQTITGYVTVRAENKKEALKLIGKMQKIDEEIEFTDADIEVIECEIEEVNG